MSTPEEIRADIERTRAELSNDVNALTDEANPKNIAKRQVDKVKDATLGVKDRIMGSASDAGSSVGGAAVGVKDRIMGSASDAGSAVGDKASSVGDAVGNAPSTVKAKAQGNPLAAGLVAFGIGYAIASAIPASQKEQQAAVAVKEKAEPLKQELADIGKEAAANLKEPAQEAVESVKATATDAAQTVKDEGTSAASDVQGQVQDSKQSVQSTAKN